GGTLLLDEIGDISPRIQLKLLRVLEEKEFERVGESTPIRVDVRVIACTNTDLREKVRLGEFREDLYFRFKVVEVYLPSLRERLEDIPLLVDHFLALFNKKFNKNIEGISDEVLRILLGHSWPGNIRELEHVIESAFVFCRGRILAPEHLPLELREYSHLKKTVLERKSDDEMDQLLESLNKTGWNKTKAARLLGMNRRTIYRKLDKYHLSKPHENM
ncbi:MAG: sigma 54-interacting transcriptional regulator, partial [Deltaproteobacteria bacterium]|nr:sigma 54-interacting transcriptional regulator [Deltaproteobacteria bacterium]